MGEGEGRDTHHVPGDLSPTTRFQGLAAIYAKHRPGYPPDALAAMVRLASLGPRSVLADVASGTGISSRFVAEAGIPVIGVEPNAEMRAEAEREPPAEGAATIRYAAGRAEQTGLGDASVDAVLAAQAFHWFDHAQALREMHRIVKPGGWVFLLGNERDESDAFTAAYGAIVRCTPEAVQIESMRIRAGEVLLRVPLFEAGERQTFPSVQTLDREGVVGRALSASYAPKGEVALVPFVAALEALFDVHAVNGAVRLHYETTLFAARRAKA